MPNKNSSRLRLLLLICFVLFSFSRLSAQDTTFSVTPDRLLDTVLDNYGNKYGLLEIALDDTVRAQASRLASVQPLVASTCNSGYFKLWLAPGCGMEDFSTNTLHNDRLQVICRMLNDVSNLINSPLSGNGNKVNIWVRDMDEITTNTSVLGLATSFYYAPSSTTVSGIIDNTSWITILSGTDAYTNVASPLVTLGGQYSSQGTFFHAMMAFNFDDISTWHLDLTQNTSSGNYDLYTVSLHEVLHALGFASLVNDNGNSKLGPNFHYYSRYDRNLYKDVSSVPTPLIVNTNLGACSMYDYIWNGTLPLTTLFPDASNCIANHSECSTAVEYHGGLGTPQDVYTPNCFDAPSSLSHFEDECSVSLGNDDQVFVMSNTQGLGSLYMKRYPKPEERQVLCDIGYSVNTTYGNNTTALGSYINYGGSICPGVQVAGINDGIDNGNWTFISNFGSSVTINHPSYTYYFMQNDHNVTGFECLEDITDGNPGTVSQTAGASTDIITYTPQPGVFGVRLLRYVPVNGSEKGNITYIYVFVTNGDCAGSACNMIVNGGFESSQGCGPLQNGAEIDCWNELMQTADLYSLGCSNPMYNVPTNQTNPPLGPHVNSVGPNEHFIGLVASRQVYNNVTTHWNEAVQTELTTPLIAGNTYTISFWARTLGTNSWNFDFPLFLCASPSTLAPINNTITALPGSITELTTTGPVIIPLNVDDQWHHYSYDVTIPGTTNLNNFILMGGGFQPPTYLPPTFYLYLFVDDVQIDLTSNACAFTLPQTMTTCDPLLDLTQYVTIPGGTFSGYGVTGTDLDPVAALQQSLANNNGNTIAIHYTYVDGNGCPKYVDDEITIINTNPISIGGPNEICPNTAFTLNVVGSTTGSTNTWTPSVTCLNGPCSSVSSSLTTPTTYVVTNTDLNGCISVASILVNPTQTNFLVATASPSVACNGQTVQLLATGGMGYVWSPSTGLSCTNCNNPTFTALPGTTVYTLNGTNTSGCPGDPVTVHIVVPYEQACDPCAAFGQNVTFNTIGDVNGIVTQNSLAGNYFVNQDLYIQGNVLWMDAVVYIAPGVQIEVMPGSSLEIMHSHLFSCQMWKGIKVSGTGSAAGKLKIWHHSFIEDAEQAVYVPNGAYPTGTTNVLWIENSIFNKNLTSIEINNNTAPGYPAYPYRIRGNVFTSRNFNVLTYQTWPFTWPTIDTGPDGPRQYWYPGTDYLPPVKLDDPTLFFTPTTCNNGQPAVEGVKVFNIGDNTIQTELVIGEVPPVWETEQTNSRLNVFDNLRYGIYAYRANVASVNNTFMYMQGQVMSFGPVQGTGIYARDILPAMHRLRVYQPPGNNNVTNRFYENLIGVETRDYYSVVGQRAMMVSNHDINNVPFTGIHGYLMRTPKYKGYDLTHNMITNIDNGITFEATTYAITGGEGQIAGPVSISDNIIQAAYGPPTTQFLTNAIWMSNLINCYPCVNNQYFATSDIKVLNNTINNTRNGIFASNFQLQPVIDMYNNITMEDFSPHTQYGINHTLCTRSRIIQNEIAGEDYALNTDLARGILVKRGDNTIVRCNYTFNTNIGIEYDNWNPNTTWRFNEMRNHKKGYVLNNTGDIGWQGTWNDAIHNIWSVDNTTPFLWTGSNYHTFTNNSFPIPSSLWIDNMLPDEEPLNNASNPAGNEYLIWNSYYPTTGSFTYPCQPFDYIELQQLVGGGDEEGGGAGEYYRVAQDQMDFQSQEERLKWNNQYQLWRNIKSDSSILDTSTVLQEFNSIASGTRYNHLTSIEGAVAQGEFALAESLLGNTTADQASGIILGNDSVVITDDSAANNIVENYKLYYEIYMRYMQDSLLSTDTAEVLQLSESCPLVEGDVVYNFRNLYNAITRSMRVFEDSCVLDSAGNFGNAGKFAKPTPHDPDSPKKIVVRKANEQVYTLSPNPYSSGALHISQKITDKDIVSIKIFNSASQEVYSGQLRFSQNQAEVRLPQLRQGIYLVRLRDKAGSDYILKLTII